SYFFEQQDLVDKLVFTDTPDAHTRLATPSLRYSPPSGMQGAHVEEVVTAFNLSCTQLPQQVVIRTYNWHNPNKPIVGKAPVAADGLGDVYLTHENVTSDAEANRLAQIRAEELLCRSRVFSGTSAVPTLRPGFVFTLTNHYNPAFNQDYFLTAVTHEGSQEAFLTLGLGLPMHNVKDHYFYHNTFSCIEAQKPFRPARLTRRASINGVIHAFIDGAGSGARPELDEHGRYKVLFPFDVSARKDGNASCWIRMAQPQIGNDSGMSFPLLPGTEVTVTFANGNPDCPIISGALANVETGALTRNENNNFTGIRTPGGNQLTFGDKDKKQGFSLLTASGRGLSMSAGSTESATLTTDSWLTTGSLMGTSIATLGQALTSSVKISQKASNGTAQTIFTSGMKTVVGLSDSIFTALSKTEKKAD
ncbi:MAG: type VI secretion system tip protein VgrG, partial [Bilophila sp.]